MATLDIQTVPSFYQRYVLHVHQLNLIEALQFSHQEMNSLLSKLQPEKLDYAYAPGKWTTRELLCHIADAERIFAYRALTFSRNDQTPLPGFDENAYVPESNASSRTLDSIKEELEHIRKSTIDLFKHCSEEMLTRKGRANNTEISVLALGYVVAGHMMHHIQILKERYLS